MKTRLIPALILLLASACALHAAVPLLINYQGVVMDSAGTAIGTTTPVNRKIIFRIFDHPSSTATASRLWSEEHTVTILNGEFSILLGQGAAFGTEGRDPLDKIFSGATTDRFLEITVDNGDGTITTADQPISPRQQLTSVAYAMRAKMADTVGAGDDLLLTPSTGATGNFGLGWYGDADTDRTFSAINNINGPVLYGTGGGVLGTKNETTESVVLRWNSSGNVGIGTSSPTAKLDVNGGIKATGTDGFTFNTGDIDGGLFSPADGVVAIRTNSTERLRVDSSGQVGIGTTAPRAALSLGSALGDSKLLLFDDGTNEYGLGIGSGQFRLHTNSATDRFTFLARQANGSELMTILGTGNVGIGTTSPASTLDVNGTLNASTSITTPALTASTSITTPALTASTSITTATVTSPVIGPANVTGTNQAGTNLSLSGGASTGSGAGGAVIFSTAAAGSSGTTSRTPIERMRITSTGNVGIGTSAPLVPLQVQTTGTATINAHSFPPSTSGDWNHTSAANNSRNDVSIYGVGALHINTLRCFSDERIKSIQGISNSQSDLDTLLSVQITDYRYKDAVTRGFQPQKKVIAQQVEKVFPQAVSQSTDVVPDIFQKAAVKAGWIELKTNLKKGERVRLIAEKDEGVHEVLEVREGAFRTTFEPNTDSVFVYGREVKDFRTVDYEAISMLNVSATQEIARRLEAKTAEVAALEERVKKLEARDKARDAKLTAFERMLETMSKPAARTVSLTSDGAQ